MIASTKSSPSHRHIQLQLAASITQLNLNPKAAAYATNLFGFDGTGKLRNPHTLLGAPTSISNAAEIEAAAVGFRAALLQNVVGEPDPAMMLATEIPSSKAIENYKWLGDLPQMEEWKNDRIMSMLEAYGWAIENKKWQATVRVKNDDIADDALGLLPVQLAGMGDEARLQAPQLVARVLLNGFDGAVYPELGDGLSFDGAFFFSAAHVTGSNLLTVAFSATNLATATQLLRLQKRFDGRNLGAKGTHLFVGVEDEALAEKVLKQETLASGESNTNKGKYTLVVSPEIQLGEWFVTDLSGPVRPMLFQNREGIVTTTVGGRSGDVVGFMYDETWFGAQARNNAGYFDFRRIVGSKPA